MTGRTARNQAKYGKPDSHPRGSADLSEKAEEPNLETLPYIGAGQPIQSVIQANPALSQQVGGGFLNRRQRHCVTQRFIDLQFIAATLAPGHMLLQIVAALIRQLAVDVLNDALLCKFAFHGLLLRSTKIFVRSLPSAAPQGDCAAYGLHGTAYSSPFLP